LEGWTSQDWFRFAPKKAEPVNDLFRLSTGSLTISWSAAEIAKFLEISDVFRDIDAKLLYCLPKKNIFDKLVANESSAASESNITK
jgi:hypothetical protein